MLYQLSYTRVASILARVRAPSALGEAAIACPG